MELEQALSHLDVLVGMRLECESVLDALQNNPTTMVLTSSQMRLERVAAKTGFVYRQESGEMTKQARLKYRAEGMLQMIVNLISRVIGMIKSLFTGSSSSSSKSAEIPEKTKKAAEVLKKKAAEEKRVELKTLLAKIAETTEESGDHYLVNPSPALQGQGFEVIDKLIKETTKNVEHLAKVLENGADSGKEIASTDYDGARQRRNARMKSEYGNVLKYHAAGFKFQNEKDVLAVFDLNDKHIAAINWTGSSFSAEYIKIDPPEMKALWAKSKDYDWHLNTSRDALKRSESYISANARPPAVLEKTEELLRKQKDAIKASDALRYLGQEIQLLGIYVKIGDHMLKAIEPYAKCWWIPTNQDAEKS